MRSVFFRSLMLAVLGTVSVWGAPEKTRPWLEYPNAPGAVEPCAEKIFAELARHESQPVNRVILLIGDGMGPGALAFVRNRLGPLDWDRYRVKTTVTTVNFQKRVTDSAAAATALAGGYKTQNGMIGMNPEKRPFRSIAEQAHRAGFAVGIVTDDALTGATPAGFYGHQPKRSKTRELAISAVATPFSVLLGNAGNRSAFLPGKHPDQRNLIDEFIKSGGCEIRSPEELRNTRQRAIGFVHWENPAAAARYAEALFAQLNRNRRGFFAMIESCHPDHGGHANNPAQTVDGVLKLAAAARAAVEFAARNPGTLVIVTADHETGRIEVNGESGAKARLRYRSGGHTELPVELFAAGSGAGAFAPCADNTDVPKIIAKLLKLTLPEPIPPSNPGN